MGFELVRTRVHLCGPGSMTNDNQIAHDLKQPKIIQCKIPFLIATSSAKSTKSKPHLAYDFGDIHIRDRSDLAESCTYLALRPAVQQQQTSAAYRTSSMALDRSVAPKHNNTKYNNTKILIFGFDSRSLTDSLPLGCHCD